MTYFCKACSNCHKFNDNINYFFSITSFQKCRSQKGEVRLIILRLIISGVRL